MLGLNLHVDMAYGRRTNKHPSPPLDPATIRFVSYWFRLWRITYLNLGNETNRKSSKNESLMNTNIHDANILQLANQFQIFDSLHKIIKYVGCFGPGSKYERRLL